MRCLPLDAPLEVSDPVVTVGTFDGVHLGHRVVLETVQAKASACGGSGVVVTFSPHPRTVIDPLDAPGVLTLLEEKQRCIEPLGIDLLAVVRFTPELRMLSPEAFVEDYLIRREVEACIENDLNVVIHTGHQAGNRNDIRNARSTHLWSLLKDYPKARFDLFHGSFPYIGDMTVLGKYFENVTLNMCWMHIMSPEVSRRALREWLDTVPVTKIFAFGGDYHVIEKVYGHLKLARADVAIVLAEKVEEGRMTTDQALEVARLLFNENPKRWYRL